MRAIRLFALAAVLIAASACGGSSTSPSDTLPGTWVGTVVNNTSGPADARITLTKNGSSIGGTWSTSSSQGGNSGSIDGSLSNGSTLALTLTPSNPLTCPYHVAATVSGNQITGTYAAFNCTVSSGGSINLTKQ